jgi:hypothetical protein
MRLILEPEERTKEEGALLIKFLFLGYLNARAR